MAHIDLPEFEEMSTAVQEKAKPILEKTGSLGEIFKLLAIDENKYLTKINFKTLKISIRG